MSSLSDNEVGRDDLTGYSKERGAAQRSHARGDVGSSSSQPLASSPRPARRIPRQRTGGSPIFSLDAHPQPPSPTRSTHARGAATPSVDGRHNGSISHYSATVSRSGDDYDDGDDSMSDRASEAPSSFGDVSSVLSTAMYRHSVVGGMPHGTAAPTRPWHADAQSSLRPSVSSSSLTLSGGHRGTSLRRWAGGGGSTGSEDKGYGHRRPPASSHELSFDSGDIDSSRHSSQASLSSYPAFPRDHGDNTDGVSLHTSSEGLYYRLPGNRGYRVAVQQEEEDDVHERTGGSSREHGEPPYDAVDRRTDKRAHSRTSSVSSAHSYPPRASRATALASASLPHMRTTATTDTNSHTTVGATIVSSVDGTAFSVVSSMTRSTSIQRSVEQHPQQKSRGRRHQSPPLSRKTSRRAASEAPDAAPLPAGPRRRRGRRRMSTDRSSNGRVATSDAGEPYDAASPLSAAVVAAAAAAGTHRTPNAPLSRRPVVTWRSHARVCAIASAPSGQVLTGGDASGVIEVWDRRTGRRLCGLGGHQAPVLSLLAIPNTSLLLSGSADRTARVWELRTLQSTMVLEGHRGLITALATLWMPDVGLNLFTGSDDSTVRQWRAATGACVHVYRGHRGPVNVVAALRPVKYIATGAGDGVFKVWNVQTLRCVSSIAAVPSRTSPAANAGVGGQRGRDSGSVGGGGGGGEATGSGSRAAATATTSSSSSSSGSGAVWDILQLNDREQSIVTATDDGAVRFWLPHWNQHAVLLKEIYLPGVLLKARSGARCLLACGTHLFVGGARGELYVWDSDTLPYVGTQRGGDHRDSAAASFRVLTAASDGALGGGGGGGVVSGGHGGVSSLATAGGGGGEAGEGDAHAELFAAAFLFHTAAITGLTRSGAQLCSSSLDHTVCRWDLHDVIPFDSDASANGAMGDGMGRQPAFRIGEGWASPLNWTGSTAAVTELPTSLSWRLGMGGSGSPFADVGSVGGGRDVAGREVIGGAALWPMMPAGGGGGGGGSGIGRAQQQHQQLEHPLLPSAATAPFASPLALLRNPKGLIEGDAGAAARDDGSAEAAFSELSPVEAAAAYTELPLTFLVEHLRSAAVSPVDIRSVAKTLCLILFTIFFAIFYRAGLAPLVAHTSDVTNALFSQTATYPLPSFARPHTFASVTSPALLERWLMLMMDQLNSLAAPVDLVLPTLLRTPGADTGVAATNVTLQEVEGGSSSSLPDNITMRAQRLPATQLVTLPALPGGVALLRHVRVRVKHVTNTSCKWNRHFLRVSADGAATPPPQPCYGDLDRSTESRETLCPDPVGVVSAPANASTATDRASADCLAYLDREAGDVFQGLFHYYDTGGYIIDLPFYVNGCPSKVLYAPIERMRRLRLVDEQRTRLVDAVLFVYHIHTRILVRLHYTLEMPRGGAWIASTDARPCPMFNLSAGSRERLTLACVVVMLVLLLVLLGLLLYDFVMAYYVGKLLSHIFTLAVLMDVAGVTLGMCVVGFALRWIDVSRSVDMNVLLRYSVPGGVDIATDYFGNLPVTRVVAEQTLQLRQAAIAFNGLVACTAVEAVLVFLTVALTMGRLVTFMHTIESALRQICVQLAAAAVMMLLSLISFALAAHLLFGSRDFAYATFGSSLWHLLLYFAASQSVNTDGTSPLTTDRRISGKILFIAFNYVCRIPCYLYLISLVIERVQAVAKAKPHVSLRVLAAKWWYDVQYQIALTGQRGPDVFGGAGGMAAATAAAADDAEKKKTRSTLAASFSTGRHRRVVIEHVWRRLRSLLQEQEEAQQRREQMTAASKLSAKKGQKKMGTERRASLTSISHFLDRHADATAAALGGEDAAAGERLRNWQRSRDPQATASPASTATPAAAGSTPVASNIRNEAQEHAHAFDVAAGAPLVHVRLRLTDLLLLLSEDERTPFARNVIRHAWDTLAWMYHYHQHHAIIQYPEERWRRQRLEGGIHEARLRLEPLFAVVRATQARLEAHEARLRPLAKAVVAVATGQR